MQAREAVLSQIKTRKMKRDEFSLLRSVLPSISDRSNTSPIDVIEEAIKYIAHLQATLEDNTSSSMTTAEVQQQFRETSANVTNYIQFKERRIASFHSKFNSVPKPRTLKARGKRTKGKGRQQAREESTT